MTARNRRLGCPSDVTRARRIVLATLLAGLFAIYVALRPLLLYVNDSYAWVNTVETGAFGYFFHPHHILYIPLAWRWNALVHAIAPGVSTWTTMAMLSAMFGCAGAAAMYLTLRRLGAHTGAAIAGAGLPAFAFGYWFFASTPEVYTLSAACGLWTFYFLARLLAEKRLRFAAWAGVAAGFAALFHQTGVFLFVPAAAVAISTRRTASGAAIFAAFTAAFGALVAPVYIAGAWSAVPALTPTAFARWIFLFAGEGYGGFSVTDTLKAPVGAARGFVGGQAALDALRGVSQAGWPLWAGLSAACAAAAGGVVLVVKSLRRIGSMGTSAKAIVLAAAATFAVYAAFSVYFDAVNFEWWTIPTAILAVAVTIPALASRRPATVTALATAGALLVANLCLDFSYRRNPGADFLLNAARSVAVVTTPRDVIITPSYVGSLLWYEHRDRNVFCPDKQARMSSEGGAREELRAAAAAAERAGGRVVIAGADREAGTAAFVRTFEPRVPAEKRRTIGTMRFLDGGRRYVQTVAEVPITAIEPEAVANALGAMRLASVEGEVGR